MRIQLKLIIRVGKLLYINGSFSIEGLDAILEKVENIFNKMAQKVLKLFGF